MSVLKAFVRMLQLHKTLHEGRENLEKLERFHMTSISHDRKTSEPARGHVLGEMSRHLPQLL